MVAVPVMLTISPSDALTSVVEADATLAVEVDWVERTIDARARRYALRLVPIVSVP
jgi:hypothetical protein